MLESKFIQNLRHFPSFSQPSLSTSPEKLDFHVIFLSLCKYQPGHKVGTPNGIVQIVHIAPFHLFLVLHYATAPDEKVDVIDKM